MEKLYSRLADKEPRYIHESQPEDHETLLSDTSNSFTYVEPSRGTPPWAKALAIVLSFFAATVFGALVGRRWPSDLDSTCTRHVSRYCKHLEDDRRSQIMAD